MEVPSELARAAKRAGWDNVPECGWFLLEDEQLLCTYKYSEKHAASLLFPMVNIFGGDSIQHARSNPLEAIDVAEYNMKYKTSCSPDNCPYAKTHAKRKSG